MVSIHQHGWFPHLVDLITYLNNDSYIKNKGSYEYGNHIKSCKKSRLFLNAIINTNNI